MKMDVFQDKLGALKHKRVFKLGWRLVPFKMVKRLWVELSLHVLTEGAVHPPTTNALMKMAVLSMQGFTFLI
jgi:hypothetical protein